MKQIQIINGPNLNLLGVREPEIYGTQTFEDFFIQLKKQYPTISLHYYQSNHEGDLIDKLHEVGFKYDEAVALAKEIGYSKCVTFENREKQIISF